VQIRVRVSCLSPEASYLDVYLIETSLHIAQKQDFNEHLDIINLGIPYADFSNTTATGSLAYVVESILTSCERMRPQGELLCIFSTHMVNIGP